MAEHTWQLMRILDTICTNVTPSMWRYTLYHDIGEVGTGDIPFPVKKENPQLKDLFDGIEDQAVTGILAKWGMARVPGLTPHEKHIIKLSEYIEMWEWGMHELMLGNKLAKRVADRCLKIAYEYIMDKERIPEDVAVRAAMYIVNRKEEWNV